MLTVVLAVAVVGIVLLAAAVVFDNTIVAFGAIALAAVGLVLLTRDWLAERRSADVESGPVSAGEAEPEHVVHESLEPDEFEPDVPYEEFDEPPDGDNNNDLKSA